MLFACFFARLLYFSVRRFLFPLTFVLLSISLPSCYLSRGQLLFYFFLLVLSSPCARFNKKIFLSTRSSSRAK